MKTMKIRSAAGLLVAAALIALLVWGGSLCFPLVGYCSLLRDREWLNATLKASGWLGPLVFVAIQTGQVLLAPIPGDVTGFLGGYLFGAWQGFLLSTIGLTIGSMLNFFIGHFLGERVVRRLVRPETYQKYNEMVRYKGILVIFFFFLLPGFPKDSLCLFLGLTTLPTQAFFVLSTIGRIPGTIALSLQGSSILQSNYMIFAVATAAYVLFAIFAYMTRDPLYRWISRQGKLRGGDTV